MPSMPLAPSREVAAARVQTGQARHISLEQLLPPLILSPSLGALLIFVYIFIGTTFFVLVIDVRYRLCS